MAGLVQITRIRKQDFHAEIRELNEKKKQWFGEPQLPLDRLSKRLDERVSLPPDAAVPECTTCGVCCLFALIVPVTYGESRQVGSYRDILLDDAEEEIVIERVLPRAAEGHCVNLEGEIGKSIGCSIYPDRPQVCHDFDAGSDRCHEYRRMFGLEPQLSDEELAASLAKLCSVERPVVIEDVSIVSSGKITRTSLSVADGEMTETVSEQLSVIVFFDDEEPHELHTFEYGTEQWLESDLLGLTREQALERIAEQAGW